MGGGAGQNGHGWKKSLLLGRLWWMAPYVISKFLLHYLSYFLLCLPDMLSSAGVYSSNLHSLALQFCRLLQVFRRTLVNSPILQPWYASLKYNSVEIIHSSTGPRRGRGTVKNIRVTYWWNCNRVKWTTESLCDDSAQFRAIFAHSLIVRYKSANNEFLWMKIYLIYIPTSAP